MPEYPTADELDWEAAMDDVPGYFATMCQMDALDWMGPDRFVAWMKEREA